MDREWKDLMDGVREESLTEEEFARLEERLRQSEEDRADYLRRLQVLGLLESFPPRWNDLETVPFSESEIRRAFPMPLGVVSLAAAALLAVACAVLFALQWSPNSSSRAPVATLLLAEDCRWEGGSDGPVEGQVLPSGSLRLLEGSAVIRFLSGAEVILRGDAKVDLISAGSVRLHHGEAVVRAEDGAEGFTVVTPEGDLVDLGTEFAVKVDNSGTTELHVHEGEVAARETVISAGSAVRFEHGGREHKSYQVELNALRFREALAQSNPRERRDLMWVYEGFHVDEGDYTFEEIEGGKGWSGPWRLRRPEEHGQHGPDASSGMRISHGRMNMAWPVKGGKLGMLEFPPGRSIRVRSFASPIDLKRNGVFYFSFLAAETAVEKSARVEPAMTGRDDLRITFRSSEDYFGESLSFGWSMKRIPRVQVGGGGLQRALRAVPEDETVFCVAKVTHSKNSPDRIQFRFYRESDSLDVLEPADWDIELGNVDLDARLDLLLVTSEGDCTRFVDEIRIGPSWRSVTPLDRNRKPELSQSQ